MTQSGRPGSGFELCVTIRIIAEQYHPQAVNDGG